jgi:hypothetical protein
MCWLSGTASRLPNDRSGAVSGNHRPATNRPEVDEVTRNAIHSVNFVAFAGQSFGGAVEPSGSTRSKSGRDAACRCKQTNSNIASGAAIGWLAAIAVEDGLSKDAHMLRYLTLVALSALIGSALATLAWVAWLGGTGAPDPARFVIGFTISSLVFTFPGAIILAGLRAVVGERGVDARFSIVVVMLVAAVSGATIATMISLQLAALGSVYALATAVVLTCLERLMDRSPKRAA